MNATPSFFKKYGLFLAVVVGFLILDQWTKHLIHSSFRWGETVKIIDDFFWLTYVRNKGAAFGMLHNMPYSFRQPFFLIVPTVAMGVVFYLFKKTPLEVGSVRLALSLIFSGALGNLIDRARFEYVIDFLDFHWMDRYHWPAFNVADCCIVIGVGLMMIDTLKRPAEPEPS